jgi:hypothetical protein
MDRHENLITTTFNITCIFPEQGDPPQEKDYRLLKQVKRKIRRNFHCMVKAFQDLTYATVCFLYSPLQV